MTHMIISHTVELNLNVFLGRKLNFVLPSRGESTSQTIISAGQNRPP